MGTSKSRRIRSCFMNEINAPFGDEFERDMPEASS
jgi:hypothetical protein